MCSGNKGGNMGRGKWLWNILIGGVCAVLVLSVHILSVRAEKYEYDKLNRVVKVIYDDGRYVRYVYDANGNIKESKLYGADGKEIIKEPSKPGSGKEEPGGTEKDDPDSPGNAEKDNSDDTSQGDSGSALNTGSGSADQSGNKPGNQGTGKSEAATQKIAVRSRNASYTIRTDSKGKSTATLEKLTDTKKKSYTVPDRIKVDGKSYPVTEIADNAFQNNTKLKKITIGKNIIRIGKKAFYGAKNLKKITVKTTVLAKVGKNALKGIHQKAVIKVPKKKLKAYRKLFQRKGQKNTVKIK